jgi:hypothetical protein
MSFRSFEFETALEHDFNLAAAKWEKYLHRWSYVGRTRVLLGLYNLWKVTGKKYDAINFSMLAQAAFESNHLGKNEFLKSIERNNLSRNYSYEGNSLADLPSIVQTEKRRGNSVAIKFGHYRRITIPQLFELNAANDFCDFLILGIESGDRTRAMKTEKIELSDQQRLDIFTNSGLANVVIMINSSNLSDKPYEDIVNSLRPNIVFASQEWGDGLMDKYRFRARSIGAKLIMLPEIGNLHTTDIENFIF